MNSLDLIKKSDPSLYSEFLKAFSRELGLDAGTFRCPNCDQPLHVSATVHRTEVVRRGRPAMARPKRAKRAVHRPPPGSLFQLLVDLARLRNTTTGTINREFTKTFKSKKLPAKELREAKIEWTKQQIAKAKKAA
jgi:hypothetical protein